jgi:hypothetical protein
MCHRQLRVLCFLVSTLQLPMARADDAASAPPSQSSTDSAPQPDYQQTRDWILSKIDQFGANSTTFVGPGGGLWTFSWTYSDFSIVQNTLRFTQTWQSHPRNNPESDNAQLRRTEVTVNLAKIATVVARERGDPNLPGAWELVLISDTQSINYNCIEERQAGGCGPSANDVSVNLCIGQAASDRQDMAARLKKAFENLIRICKERTPKSNEPF